MSPEELIAQLNRRPLLLDGGLGTMLIAMGLPPGMAPEHWIAAHPERLREAHRRYVEAGSDVIHTVTFGATPAKLAASGVRGTVERVNAEAVALARAVGGAALIAGDVGPTGRFLPPTGDATEAELEDEYRAQVEVLAKSGVDLISIETMYDVREALAALRASRATGLAVICSMTFEVRKRGTFTFMGDALVPSLGALSEAGATVVGMNCSVTSDVMLGMVESAVAGLPGARVVAQPNAGQPITTVDGIRYDADPGRFADDMIQMLAAGARVVGGCCGTDERFIRELKERMSVGARC